MGNDHYLICPTCKIQLWATHNFCNFDLEDLEQFIDILESADDLFPTNRFITIRKLSAFYEDHKNCIPKIRLIDPINDDVDMNKFKEYELEGFINLKI